MENQSTNSNPQNEKLSAAIQKTWSKLTPSEIASYSSRRDEFFSAVKSKQGIERSEAEKIMKSLEAANSNTPSSTSKVANA